MRRTLLSTLAAGAALVALATAAGAQSLADAKQGGEMVVTYKDDVSTLDPAIGYDWQNWSMIKSLFDGLMDYEPGTTTLVPDLAESYEISGDGTVFTFKLRPGVKFHNGRELVADDVKYSIERVVKPETQSPGAGFFATIAGFDDFQSGAATELAGIKVVDPATIEFTLSQPDATFLHKMALNFAHVVPKEAVDEAGADFGRKPGRHRRLQARRVDPRPARRLRAQPRLLEAGRAEARPDHLRDRPGADRRPPPPPARRGRHPRRRHPAGAVPAGEAEPAATPASSRAASSTPAT